MKFAEESDSLAFISYADRTYATQSVGEIKNNVT